MVNIETIIFHVINAIAMFALFFLLIVVWRFIILKTSTDKLD